MLIVFFIISLVSAFDYEKAFKSGQRRFTSSSLKSNKQEDSYVSYDIELVERFHHLDYNSDVKDLICGLETLDIFAKEPIDLQIGDIVAGDDRWGCGSGIARVVKAVIPIRQQKGYYEYHLETRQAELEELFVKANIQLELPEEEDNLKGGSTSETFSHTFSKSFEKTVPTRSSYITFTAGADVSVPVKLSGLTVDVDNSDKTKTFKMTLTSGLTYTVRASVTASKSIEGECEGEIGSIGSFSFSFSIGVIPITIAIEPTFYAGLEYNFGASATLTFSYTKKYEAIVKFDSGASSKITASASDKSTYNSPKLSLSKSITAELSPYVKGALEIKGKVFGITVLTGAPYLKVKITGSLTSARSASFTPALAWGYSIELLGKDLVGYEKNLKSGNGKTISY